MIFASISPGRYYLIEDGSVVAEIDRIYEFVGSYRQAIGYTVEWLHDESVERFKNLPAIYEKYGEEIENYPGYMAVLQKDKWNGKAKRNRARQNHWRF